MKLSHSRRGAGAQLADPNAAKSGTPQTRLLTPAVQRVIAWHQERITAQHGGGDAEAPSPASLDAAQADAEIRS